MFKNDRSQPYQRIQRVRNPQIGDANFYQSLGLFKNAVFNVRGEDSRTGLEFGSAPFGHIQNSLPIRTRFSATEIQPARQAAYKPVTMPVKTSIV